MRTKRALAANELICGLVTIVIMAPPAFCQNQFLNRGIDAYNKGQYAEAMGMFGAAKATESDNPQLHYYMANCLIKLNSKQDAIREYKLALDLAHESTMTGYCQAALRSLGALPSKSTPVAPGSALTLNHGQPQNSPRAKTRRPRDLEASQQPQVVSILCGCPLCERVDMIITDLQSKYGDKVGFIRTTMDAEDEKSKGILTKYRIKSRRDCPTVLMIDNKGQLANTFKGVISEVDLNRDVELAAKYSPTAHLGSPIDDHLASIRNSVINEVDARIAQDQIRVDAEVAKLLGDKNEQAAGVPKFRGHVRGSSASQRNFKEYWGAERDQQIQDIDDEARKKIKVIQDDFERKKREWYAAAEDKIRALQSTQMTVTPNRR